MIRGMSCYDPHFGAAFRENTWNAGFDHAETLTRIQCPALLLHAKTEIMEDGTLNGAMSQEEADCIVTLIPNCKYLKVSHFLKPCETIRPRSIIVICFQKRNLFCLPKQKRFFHDFRGKTALNIGKRRSNRGWNGYCETSFYKVPLQNR